MSTMSASAIHLLPRPQRLTLLEGFFSLAGRRFILVRGEPDQLQFSARRLQSALIEAGVHWELTAAGEDDLRVGAVLAIEPAQVARPQGYHLAINPEQIRITGHDPAGLFYGVSTVIQLLCQYRQHLPCLRVDDWPDFLHRGLVLDISRDKIPTMKTLYELLDLLASWKVNQIQLYMEHTFAYRDHKTVWAEADPLTGDEVLALDAWCRQRYVELVPYQSSFAHMNRWLKHDRYRHLAEAPTITWPWGEQSNEPFTLCPGDPGSIELLRGLYAELLPHFTSRQFNVGCDETFGLGEGRSRQACKELGTGRVYLAFLKQIHRLVREHGRMMMFWADVILRHPELIPELPSDCIPMEWGNAPDHPFAARCALLADAGLPFYVLAGTNSYNSTLGRTNHAKQNLLAAAENALAYGAIGFCNSEWGDNGYLQYLPVAYLGLAYGSALSWALVANRDLDLPRVLDLFAFQDEAGVMGRLVYDLGNAYLFCGVDERTGTPLVFRPLIYPQWYTLEDLREPDVRLNDLRMTMECLDKAIAPLEQARMARPDAALIADEFRNDTAMMRYACRLRIAMLEAEGVASVPKAVGSQLVKDLEQIIPEHKRLWLARNRPGGLADSTSRLETWLARCQSLQ